MFRSRQLFVEWLLKVNKEIKVANGCFYHFDAKPGLVKFCQNTFEVPHYRIESLMLQYPKLQKIEESQIENVISVLGTIGVSKDSLLNNPTLFKVHPITIDNRWHVLVEAGLVNVNLQMLTKYVTITRKYTIAELKMKQMLSQDCDLWKNLINCFSEWPDIQRKMKKDRFPIDPTSTLYDVRMMCLQRFLELSIDLPEKNFNGHLETYVSLKHRSLRGLSEVIHILKNEIKLGKDKLQSHGFLYLLQEKNLRTILSEISELGGVDIKAVFRKNPGIMKKSCRELLKIKQIMKEENISDEIQSKNLLVYTFNAETIRSRIREFKTLEQYDGLQENPRICDFIYSRTKVCERLQVLEKANKRCTSLHKLTTNQKSFDRFAQDFGDKTKGVDILRALSKIFATAFPPEQVRRDLLKHQYWTHAPLPSIIAVVDHLQSTFSLEEIFGNLQMLLYSLSDVKKYTDVLLAARDNRDKDSSVNIPDIDYSILSNFQLLSLVTYLLEKEHHFSCDGIWEKQIAGGVKAILAQ